MDYARRTIHTYLTKFKICLHLYQLGKAFLTQKGNMKLKGKVGTQEGNAESIEDEGFSEEE